LTSMNIGLLVNEIQRCIYLGCPPHRALTL
jgi:hypothetical protein